MPSFHIFLCFVIIIKYLKLCAMDGQGDGAQSLGYFGKGQSDFEVLRQSFLGEIFAQILCI